MTASLDRSARPRVSPGRWVWTAAIALIVVALEGFPEGASRSTRARAVAGGQATACTVSPHVNTYRSSTLEFQFPGSWTKEDAKGLLLFGQADGNGDCALIVGFDPDMRGEVIGATATLLRKTLEMYPDARTEGPPNAIAIGRNYPAASTTWMRATAGNEMRNQIVGVATSGGLLFFQFSYKTNAAASAVPVFERILASMRIEDVLPSSRTAVPTTPPGVNVQTLGAGTEELTPRTKQLHETPMSTIRNVGNLDGAWTGKFTALGLASTADVKNWSTGSFTPGVQYGKTTSLAYGLQFASGSGTYRFTIDKDGDVWMNQVGTFTVDADQLELTPSETQRRPGDWVELGMPEGFDSLHERPVRLRFQIACDANGLRIDFASRREHTFAKPDRLLHAYRQGDGGGCR